MSIIETDALVRVKDSNGQEYLIYPITKAGNILDLEESLSTFLSKKSSTTVDALLSSSKWTGEEAPYVYDLSTEYPDSTYNIDVLVNMETLTEEQREALISACITGGSSNKMYSFGDKPSVDIPVVLVLSATLVMENPPVTTETVLLSSNWTGNEAPYVYDLSGTYPDATYDIDVLVDIDKITSEQTEELINAKITGGTNNKLYALGDKPTKDIPIVLEVTTK